jgi:uncharacterized protein involved in exopolysaccharide biosynthesis
MEKQLELKDIKNFIRRRKKSLFITFFLFLLLGLSIAIILPPIYQSQTTIIIEEQQISEEYVQSANPGYIEERIEMINQQVLARDKLIEIINQYDLYAELRDKLTMTEIVNKMRGDIFLENIQAPLINRRTSRSIISTVAFTLSYEGKNPESVKKVTDRLASLYIEADTRKRTEAATSAENFLNAELSKLKKQMHVQETKISKFKKSNLNQLPEYTGSNLHTISRLEEQKQRIEMQLRSAEEKNIMLKGKIATVDPLTPIIIDGEKVASNPKERLKSLYLELISLQSIYSDKHPDIKQIKREISELEGEIGKSDTYVAKVKRLMYTKSQLAIKNAELGSNHPDVKKLTKEEKILSQEVDKLAAEQETQNITREKPDNPLYITMQAQIASNEADINSFEQALQKIDSEIAKYYKRVENAPRVEKEYNELSREFETIRVKYREVSDKLMAAKSTKELEDTDRGEKFIIKSKAYLPEKPSKPNRLGISILAFIIALGASIGFASIRESIDHSLKTADQIKAITALPVLSAISLIVTKEEKRTKRYKRIFWSLGILMAFGLSLIILDQFIITLDDLALKLNQIWTLVLERIGMIA